MYYFIYCILYIISLLPFPVIYLISDGLTFIVYHFLRYRRKVVLDNLAIAFPEKSLPERKIIARQFYRNFIDTLLETVKMISISDREFEKRCTADLEICNALIKQGKSIHLHGSHQMNWEYGNWIYAKKLSIPMAGIYMPITNSAIEKIFFRLRTKYNTVLVSTRQFSSRMHNVFRNQYAFGVVADQNPGLVHNAYWLNFFNRAAPFITVPEKSAVKNNAAIVFVKFIKLRRGHYHFEARLITQNAGEMEKGEITRLYRNFLEEAIKSHPDNYLWSHRRWKHIYGPQYTNKWIDDTPPPL